MAIGLTYKVPWTARRVCRVAETWLILVGKDLAKNSGPGHYLKTHGPRSQLLYYYKKNKRSGIMDLRIDSEQDRIGQRSMIPPSVGIGYYTSN